MSKSQIKRIKAQVPLEHDEQVAFVQWFRLQYKDVRIFAIPNAAKRGYALADRLKMEGMVPGVPDLWIPEWRTVVEMKRVKGGRLNGEQEDWLNYLTSIGWRCIVGYGADDAIKKIKQMINMYGLHW